MTRGPTLRFKANCGSHLGCNGYCYEVEFAAVASFYTRNLFGMCSCVDETLRVDRYGGGHLS
jgi:hypothetical protein